jgi:hypothetical protein
MFDQFVRTGDIGNLSFSDDQPQGASRCIDGHVQFRTQPAARSAKRLRTTFFNAPAECWCALTMAESMRMCSISVSAASACTTRCQTPLRRQREKRMYTVCPSTKLHWQIAPRTASASDPQYSFEKPAIVHSRSTTVAFFARQDRFDFLPYLVAQ